MVKFSFLLIVVFLLVGCALIGVFPRERLRIKRVDQSSAIEKLNLKTDGIYVYDRVLNKVYFRTFIYLFRNGVCYVAGYSANNDQHKNNAEDTFINQKILPQSAPLNWGTYQIKNDSLFIEYWTIASGGIDYNRAAWKGRIINEKTIRMEKGRKLVADSFFHFIPLKNKPDSTNRFIK